MPTIYTSIRNGTGWTVVCASDHSRPIFSGVAVIGSMPEGTAKTLAAYLDHAYSEGFVAGAQHVQGTIYRALRQAGGGVGLIEFN